MDAIRELKNIDKDDILAALGLETKKTAAEYLLPVLGLFSAGIVVGVGVGMLFAPKSGRELRESLGKRVEEVRERAMQSAGMGEEVTTGSSH